jgi:hypothetical protein
MNTRKRIVLAVAAATVTGGLLAAPAANATTAGSPAAPGSAAQSATIHPDGFEPGSVVVNGSCKGWMNTRKQNGKWYAQGLVQSWNGNHCDMILERKHNGNPAWTVVSGMHSVVNGQDHTGWYYDDAGYKSHACIYNHNGSQRWVCGGAI